MYDAPVVKTTKEGKEYLSIKASTKNPKAKEDENSYTTFFVNVFSEAQIDLFKKCGKVLWKCNNCGYVHEGDSAPEMCPACAHPKGHFEVLADNF